MKLVRTIAGLSLLLSVLVISSIAAAQANCLVTGPNGTCTTVATTSTITVPTILKMTIGAGTTSFGTLTVADYTLGRKDVAGPAVTVKANQAWRVQISSAAVNWTAVNSDPLNPARTTKPRADLLWGPSVGGSFTAMSATATQIGSGSGTGGTTIPLAFRSLWNYTLDTPGSYSIAVTFTLLSP